MTETELQREVQALCDEYGLLHHHCRDGRWCDGPRGLPDLIIAGVRGVIFAELKSEDGETSADQDLWGWMLTKAWREMGAQAHPSGWILWRPADLDSGHIRNYLERIAAP